MILLNWCCVNPSLKPSWGQFFTPYLLWPIGTSGSLWPFGHNTFSPGHILPSLASLANFHLTNPQAFIFVLVPGGPFSLPGVYGSSSHHQNSLPNPLYWEGFGINGFFGAFRPPMASTAHGPRSEGPLGLFWPNPMRPKEAKGGSTLVPKAKWAYLSQSLTMDPNLPILAKNPKGHLWPIFSNGLWKTPEATRSA
ncbi:hypothetical protein O181_083172 [Austropuccinia psidii MF-1]|uniref:Uncharacterized protein n=1 Tax=Austropuccinia psidii MF-1 TaxID=1389203 RepID=A0A9Q3FRU9_9BASI|nr:hypothetical protein [Austropuccinia psidii MF-1]